MRKRCYCGNSERGRVSERASERPSEGSLRSRSLTAATRRPPTQKLFSVFLLLTPSSKGIQGRERERRLRFRFCTLLRNFEEQRSAGPQTLQRCARVRHVMGRETFLIHLLSTPFLSPVPTPPTNNQPRMSLTQRLPAEYETFSARHLPHPQAPPLPFLSMLAALFVPPLVDETRAMRRPSFTWCGDGEGRR